MPRDTESTYGCHALWVDSRGARGPSGAARPFSRHRGNTNGRSRRAGRTYANHGRWTDAARDEHRRIAGRASPRQSSGTQICQTSGKRSEAGAGIGAATVEQDSKTQFARRAGRTRTRSASGRCKSVGIGERKTTLDGRIFQQKGQNEILKPGRPPPCETGAATVLSASGFIGQEIWRFFHDA